MTVYKVLVSNINSDLSFEPHPEASWSQKLDSDEALVMLLNRIAIASSHEKPLEYPEIEITADSKRAFLTVVSGHIYYTELDTNRHNLKVVAENVPDLLKGLAVELEKPPEEKHEYVPQHARRYHGSSPSAGVFSWAFGVVAVAVLAFCAIRVWNELADRPSLIERPKFEYQANGLNPFLERYAGLYVNEYREGSLVIELETSGKLFVYELWRSPTLGTYLRVPVAEYPVEFGMYENKPALLAKDKYVFAPSNQNSVSMYGLSFQRHDGVMTELGPVSDQVR